MVLTTQHNHNVRRSGFLETLLERLTEFGTATHGSLSAMDVDMARSGDRRDESHLVASGE